MNGLVTVFQLYGTNIKKSAEARGTRQKREKYFAVYSLSITTKAWEAQAKRGLNGRIKPNGGA
jgi:hypothetical protein